MAGGQILVIDDNCTWADAIVEFLQRDGFEVECAADGERGLDLLKDTVPRLVILDVHLPGMTGFEVLRELRRCRPNLPVLMVSSDDQAGPMVEALAEGATSFLRKPITLDSLRRAVFRLTAPAPNPAPSGSKR